jgi:hypothetical protein
VLQRTLANYDVAKATTRDRHERANKAIANALAWAASSAEAVHDPYTNAQRLFLATDNAAKARLRAELSQTAVHDHEGTHWERSGYSTFCGWGRAGDLETTAQVLTALGKGEDSAQDRALVNAALYYILRSQDQYGIWYSGQATVRVLQAMLPLAAEEMKTPPSSQQFQVAINGVPLTANYAEALRPDPQSLDAPRTLDVTSLLKPGHNELAFTSQNVSALASAEASASYYVPGPRQFVQLNQKHKPEQHTVSTSTTIATQPTPASVIPSTVRSISAGSDPAVMACCWRKSACLLAQMSTAPRSASCSTTGPSADTSCSPTASSFTSGPGEPKVPT